MSELEQGIQSSLHYDRVQLQCRAAASGYPAQLAVPDGEFKIPVITDIANTYEWLTDYEAFYKKRYACTPRAHLALPEQM